MKYHIVTSGDTTEALGAYGGYRVRLVVVRSAATPPCALSVYFRGSESLPEHAVPVAEPGFGSVVEALEAGYAHAVAWIDHRGGEDEG